MSGQEVAQRRGGTLVISRSVGEGFSIGEDWHFRVAEINARFVTLAISNGARDWTYQLEVDESLHITGRNTLSRTDTDTKRRTRPTVDVRVARVTSNDARLAVHAPLAMKIHRHEHQAAQA